MLIHKNEKGQSAIEFILTFAFSLGFVFLFVNLALNLTSGYLNHYVNFMASRTYLVQDSGINNEITVLNFAREEAQKTFDRYPISQFGIDAEFKVIKSGTRSGLYVGTTSQFEKPLSSMPLIGSAEDAILLSESFLGKEPTRLTLSLIHI